MLKRITVSLFGIAIGSTGLSCAMQPPSDGGNGGGAIAEFIGSLMISSTLAHGPTGDQESLTGHAVFTSAEDTSNGDGGNVIETKTFGDCIVTTTSITSGGSDDGTDDAPVVDPLDAGIEGMLSTATAEVVLTRQVEGLYSSGELSGGVFGTGETYTFAFDGGTDVAAFMTSIVLPGGFTSTTPDLSDDALTVDRTMALNVGWAPSGGADEVSVQVATANLDTFVSIVCTFDDSGSGVVPQEAMECLLDMPTATIVSISRTNSAEVDVDLTDGGRGKLTVSAQNGTSRTIIAGLDTGDIDPCDFIECPEGTVCNPNTFFCE